MKARPHASHHEGTAPGVRALPSRADVVGRPSTAPPSLDAIARDPAGAAALPLAATTALLAQAAAVQGALAARALALALAPELPSSGGVPLTVKDAAARLNVSVDWLYRRAHALPFTVRHGRALRFTPEGIAAYLRDRAGQR